MIVIDGVEYVTHAEAAARLGVAPKTLSNRLWSGALALPVAHRIGAVPFYRLSDVDAAAPSR